MARGYPDFEGPKAGLYLQPEWAAKEGMDKVLAATGTDKGEEETITNTYVPDVGKTLYITHATYFAGAFSTADRDNNQIAYLTIYAPNILTRQVTGGGNSGGMLIFPRPIKVEGGETFYAVMQNWANHHMNMIFTVCGYEV